MIIPAYTVLFVLLKYKVDIFTSSHLLAKRDVEEWQQFYEYFAIKVTIFKFYLLNIRKL